MNRRKLVAFLGVSPVALPALAADFKVQPEIVGKNVEPRLGQLRWTAKTDSISYSPASVTVRPYVVAHIEIYDGEKWVDEDSQAGVDVKNRVLRS